MVYILVSFIPTFHENNYGIGKILTALEETACVKNKSMTDFKEWKVIYNYRKFPKYHLSFKC